MSISGKLIALSMPDFYRYVKGLPKNATVPNVQGSYSQWGYKAPAGDGTIDIFLYVNNECIGHLVIFMNSLISWLWSHTKLIH